MARSGWPFAGGFALFIVTFAGCDDWPVQDDPSAAPSDPNAGLVCTRLSGIQPSTSPLVNGGLCFGIAVESSSALTCSLGVSPNVVSCVDDLLGTRYLVRWSGAQGTVVEGSFGGEIGSVSQVGASTYEVRSNLSDGVCTLPAASTTQAPTVPGQWCVQRTP